MVQHARLNEIPQDNGCSMAEKLNPCQQHPRQTMVNHTNAANSEKEDEQIKQRDLHYTHIKPIPITCKSSSKNKQSSVESSICPYLMAEVSLVSNLLLWVIPIITITVKHLTDCMHTKIL